MSNRKFFSGLTPSMLTRTQNGQDRQQTHFYWPDEFNSDQVPSPRNRMRNRSLSTASIISQSNASTDTEESRRRRSNNLKSGIEFYDMVDTTDTESVYGRKIDPTTHKKLETLKSKIEFYDFADSKKQTQDDDANSVIEVVKKKDIQEVEVTPPKVYSNDAELVKNMNKMTIQNNMKAPQRNQSQYVDSYGSDSEEESSRYQKSYRNRDLATSQRYQRRLPMPPQQLQQQQPQQQRPRRYHSHYFDDFEDDGYERYYESSRRPRLPRMNSRRRDFSPDDISDEEFFDDNRSYARKGIRDNRGSRSMAMAFPPEREYRPSASHYGGDFDNYRMNKVSSNGYGNESRLKSPPRQQTSTNEIESEARAQINSSNVSLVANRPPVKPVQRSMSINEARRRHHFNLKSNIFHNDQEYEKVSERLKPLSVRDFAANNRVGVGLPDL